MANIAHVFNHNMVVRSFQLNLMNPTPVSQGLNADPFTIPPANPPEIGVNAQPEYFYSLF